MGNLCSCLTDLFRRPDGPPPPLVAGHEEDDGGVHVTEDDDYIEILLKRECSLASRSSNEPLPAAASTSSCDRSEYVQWILTTNAGLGFASRAAYRAVAYLDRFLLQRGIEEEKNWTLEVLAVACLSLAVKMETRDPPPLPKLERSGCCFSEKSIREAEFLVLSTVEQEVSPVTPFEYLSPFASKLGIGTADLSRRATEFIFEFAKERNVSVYRPSTLAAASILAASDPVLTKESIESRMSVISSPGSLDIEQVVSCYTELIKQSYRRRS